MMERANYVRAKHERKNPPATTGGLCKSKVETSQSDADFAKAFCITVQGRFSVAEVMRVAAEIEASGRRINERLRPDERGENLCIYREGFEVLRGCWAWPVRRYFETLMGHPLDAFEHAVVLLGEELWGSAEHPGRIVSMISPECFQNEH